MTAKYELIEEEAGTYGFLLRTLDGQVLAILHLPAFCPVMSLPRSPRPCSKIGQ